MKSYRTGNNNSKLMKKAYLILIGLYLINTGYSQNWFLQNSGTANDLNSVYFVDSKTGYAVGNAGTILKTQSGGDNWVKQNSPTENSLRSVYFINSKIGYAVGTIGIILKTTNGGTNWAVLNSGTGNTMNTVRFIDADTGFVAGSGEMLITTDGGLNWIKQSTPFGGPICIIDSKMMYAAGGYNLCRYKTTNEGTEWLEYYEPYTGGRLNGIHFADSITVIAVGGCFAQGCTYSNIYYTRNGGITWGGWNRINSSYLNSVFLTNRNIAYAVGGKGIIFKSTDGGKNWDPQNSWTTESLNYVFFPNSNTGYIVGNAGTILKILEIGTKTDQINLDDSSINIYPNPAANLLILDLNNIALIPKKTNVSILNLQGQLLFKQEISQNKTEIDLSRFMSGIYILKIICPDKSDVIKLLKD
jgi:photosystem II stability/assembly factor-like uncharacterized protein